VPPKYSGIPAITDDRVLAPTVRVLVEIVEQLAGQRGAADQRAASVQELNEAIAKLKLELTGP
jgi:hypothetical protein